MGAWRQVPGQVYSLPLCQARKICPDETHRQCQRKRGQCQRPNPSVGNKGALSAQNLKTITGVVFQQQARAFPFSPSPSPTGTPLLNSERREQQLVPGWPPDPISKAPCSLTLQWADSSLTMAHFFPWCFYRVKAALPRLSPVASCILTKPFLVSLFPALINVLSKSPGLILWNLFCTKSRTHIHLQTGLRQTCSRPVTTLTHTHTHTHTHTTGKSPFFLSLSFF